MSRPTHLILLLVGVAVAVAAALALPAGARAVVVGATPVWPIPSDAPPAPPPIPSLTPAGDAAPPVDEIADPVTQSATCGEWYVQNRYGERWPAGSNWWEYRCTYEHAEDYPHPCPSTGACDAVCYGYPFDCYTTWDQRSDYFYWDGSRAVFYGESYSYGVDDWNGWSSSSLWWWDSPTANWYVVSPSSPPSVPPTASFTLTCAGLSCSFDGSGSAAGSAAIGGYSWQFGDGASASGAATTHTYAGAGTYDVTLTVTDAAGGSGVATRSVTLSPPRPPTPSFTLSCAELTCSFDASASTAGDSPISSYGWAFGDGAEGSGRTTVHTYPNAGTYTVTLTVAGSDGASASASQRINPISLSAHASKTGGQHRADLAWNGAPGMSFDVYRDGGKVATVEATAYTDVMPKTVRSRRYRVCATGGATCSNEVTVTF